MSAPAPDRDDRTLAGEYVLGLLEGDIKADVERRLASDASFAGEVEAWQVRLAAFDDSAAPQPAGDDLWRKIEAGMPAHAQPAKSAAPSIRLWYSLPALRASVYGFAVLAMMLSVALGFAVQKAIQQPVMIAVLLDGNRAGAVVHTFADGRSVLLPLTAIHVPEGKALEVWTLPSRERGPVSVGLMNQARTLQLQLKDLPKPGTDQLFEITLEPAGGSPIGRPTGPILFKGNTALAL
jgi:anti-sigma-K factor RskA